MTNLADGAVRFTLPPIMYPLPGKSGDPVAAAAAIVDRFEGLRPGAEVALKSALESAIEYFHGRSDHAIQGWAIVSEPRTGQVDGVALVRLLVGEREWSIDEYVERLHAARAAAAATATWVKFDIFTAPEDEDPRVGYYRLEIPATDAQPVAVEEALVAKPVPGVGILEARVFAQDLGVFDDVVEFAAELLAATEFLEASDD